MDDRVLMHHDMPGQHPVCRHSEAVHLIFGTQGATDPVRMTGGRHAIPDLGTSDLLSDRDDLACTIRHRDAIRLGWPSIRSIQNSLVTEVQGSCLNADQNVIRPRRGRRFVVKFQIGLIPGSPSYGFHVFSPFKLLAIGLRVANKYDRNPLKGG